MLFTSILAILAAPLLVLAGVEELQVDVTHLPETCDIKSKNGDLLAIHYVRHYPSILGRLHWFFFLPDPVA